MKIGLDIHGVLSNTELIAPFVKRMKDEGHTLYVISGAPAIEQMIELSHKHKYDLSLFDGFYSVIEHQFPRYHELQKTYPDVKFWKDWKDTWWISPEEVWWNGKAEIAEILGLDVLIDDEHKYEVGYLVGRFCDYTKFMNSGYELDLCWLMTCTNPAKDHACELHKAGDSAYSQLNTIGEYGTDSSFLAGIASQPFIEQLTKFHAQDDSPGARYVRN